MISLRNTQKRLMEDDDISLEDDLIIDMLYEICQKINKSITINDKNNQCIITISEYVFITISYTDGGIKRISTGISTDKKMYNCTNTISEITRIAEDLQTAALVIQSIRSKLV